MSKVQTKVQTGEADEKYPQNIKGGKRPWHVPASTEPRVGDGVVHSTFTIEERHQEWLRGQSNQSEYIRALLDADIIRRSLPEQYSERVEKVHNAVLTALLTSLTKEMMLDEKAEEVHGGRQ